jgi:hypothetical protein
MRILKTFQWKIVGSFTLWPLHLSVSDSRYPLNGAGPVSRSRFPHWRRDMSLHPHVIDSWFPCHPYRNLDTILTELSRVLACKVVACNEVHIRGTSRTELRNILCRQLDGRKFPCNYFLISRYYKCTTYEYVETNGCSERRLIWHWLTGVIEIQNRAQ